MGILTYVLSFAVLSFFVAGSLWLAMKIIKS